MDFFSIDSQLAKDIGLGTIGASVVLALLVLKFAKSIITKILLLAIFSVIAFLAFTQRDAVSVCVAKLETYSQDMQATSCTFFGQEIILSGIDQ